MARRVPLPTLRRAALGLVLGALLVILYRAPAGFVLDAWRSDPYYTHGAPVFALAVGLAAWRLHRARGAAAGPVPSWALLGVPLACALYLYGYVAHAAHALAWSALALAAAVALATGGTARLRLVAAPLLLAGLALPTPWTQEAGVALQLAATAASAWLLGLAGVPLAVETTTLRLDALAFEVTPACSGFQSAVSLLAVAAVVATVFPMSAARRRLVLVAAVPIALALNVARILAVVAVGLRWGADAAEGFFHGGSSALLFAFETLAVLAIGGTLRRRRREPQDAEVTPADGT